MTSDHRRILLAIGGGIAAYKCTELIRLLRERNHDIRVIMTDAATRFITPLTLQALSGHPVASDLFKHEQSHGMGHIELARWAEILVVAPTTADLLAKFSHGLADDLVSTLYLANQAPVLLAPAMNQAMWQHPANQNNFDRLRTFGASFIGPDSGIQACGEQGPGRMASPEAIGSAIERILSPKILTGRTVLITAGPTREAIDPVRFISNRSSGKMGYALARAAHDLGAEVNLVTGPVHLRAEPDIKVFPVESAKQMFDQVMALTDRSDIFIASAAVADYAPDQQQTHKIKKKSTVLHLILNKTEDILAAVASKQNLRPFTVGFAAETTNLEHYALNKLQSKNLDMIAANIVAGNTGGFDSEHNALTVYWANGNKTFPLQPKTQLAYRLMTLIAEHYENYTA